MDVFYILFFLVAIPYVAVLGIALFDWFKRKINEVEING